MSQARVVTDPDAFRAAVRDAPPDARVPVEVRTTVDDPFDAYRRARTGGWDAFLETGGGRPGRGYIAVDPIERLTVTPEAVSLPTCLDDPDRPSDADPAAATARAAQSPTLAALAGRLDGERLVRGDCDLPYPCGAIGWLAYDVARELEDFGTDDGTDDPHDATVPRLECAIYDRLATWDATDDGPVELRITACPRAGGDDPFDAGRRRALDLARAVHEGDPTIAPGGPNATGTASSAVHFESDCGRDAFTERVARVQRRIRAGETFQANVSHCLRAPATVHPVAAYAGVRAANPAPYAALLEFGVDVVSASPELLLEREDRRLLTEPIAGTRPRGADPDADDALADDLRTDAKEAAEHAMLVDLERNDLGRVCTPGSVTVPDYRRLDRHPEVMHLVSRVTGDLRPNATLADAIAATFPGGTITGAPKPRTMAIIDRVEDGRRGVYTGSVGLFGFDGRATLNIAIRTLVRRDAEYHLRVGAGIVHDSDPEREYAETLDKARGLVRAIDHATGETPAVRVDP